MVTYTHRVSSCSLTCIYVNSGCYILDVGDYKQIFSTPGHNIAKLDPLGINEADLDSSIPPELIVDSSLDSGKVCTLIGTKLLTMTAMMHLSQMFTLPKTTRIGGSETALPLNEIVKRLKDTYCQNIGVEYMFINDRTKCKCIIHTIYDSGSPNSKNFL